MRGREIIRNDIICTASEERGIRTMSAVTEFNIWEKGFGTLRSMRWLEDCMEAVIEHLVWLLYAKFAHDRAFTIASISLSH
eukprot:6327869-Amphidinium_carterae.1